MGDEKLQAKFPRRKPFEQPAAEKTAWTDNLLSFGWLRGIRDRATMLEIRHKDGTITAHGYAWLESAEFDPSKGIALNFSGRTVKLVGRNLNSKLRGDVRLFEGILRHRVPWILEVDSATVLQAQGNAVVIEKVQHN